MADPVTLMEVLKWFAISSGPIGAIVIVAKTWGWIKTTIEQHDKDIFKTYGKIDNLKTDNKEEHKIIMDKIAENIKVMSDKFHRIEKTLGRVEQFINGGNPIGKP